MNQCQEPLSKAIQTLEHECHFLSTGFRGLEAVLFTVIVLAFVFALFGLIFVGMRARRQT